MRSILGIALSFCSILYVTASCKHAGNYQLSDVSAANTVDDDLKSFPWLVQVSSTYYNRPQNNPVTIHGWGYIVKYQDSYYVVTAAHVSEGTVNGSTRILGFDADKKRVTKLAYQARLIHPMADHSVIRLDKSATVIPLAEVQGKPCQGNGPTLCFSLQLTDAVVEELQRPNFENKYVKLGLFSALPKLKSLRFDPDVPTVNYQNIALDPLLADRIKSGTNFPGKNTYVVSLTRGLGVDLLDGQLMSSFNFPKGLSGAPLLSNWPSYIKSERLVLGTVQSSARNHSIGWLGQGNTPARMVQIHAEQVKQQPNLPPIGSINGGSWTMVNGLTFVSGANPDLNISFSEIITSNKNDILLERTGDGTRGDTGDGTRGDTGDGTRGDTGDGTRGDTGDGIKVELPTKTGVLFNANGLDPKAGKEIIAFRANVYQQELLLPANIKSIEHTITYLYNGIEVTPIAVGEPLLSPFRKRIESLAGPDGMVDPNTFRLKFFLEAYPPKPGDSVRESYVLVKFENHTIAIEIDLLQHGKLTAKLGHLGEPLGKSDRFQPIISMQDNLAKTYTVDISALFMSNPWVTDFKSLSALNSPKLIIRSHDQQFLLARAKSFLEILAHE